MEVSDLAAKLVAIPIAAAAGIGAMYVERWWYARPVKKKSVAAKAGMLTIDQQKTNEQQHVINEATKTLNETHPKGFALLTVRSDHHANFHCINADGLLASALTEALRHDVHTIHMLIYDQTLTEHKSAEEVSLVGTSEGIASIIH